MVVEELVLGDPKPVKGIDPLLLQNVNPVEKEEIKTETSACKCGGSCGYSCNCGGSCGEKCSCKSKKDLGEILLKVSIVLAIGTAAYLLIKK